MHEHDTSFRKPAAAIASIARRQALGIIAAAAALPFLGHSAQALARVGAVEVIRGNAFARLSDVRRLSRNNNILLGDLVWTEKQSRMTVGSTSAHGCTSAPKRGWWSIATLREPAAI